MLKRNSIFDYLVNTMVIYGISVISLCVFCVLFGKDAKEFSSMFRLGTDGLAIDTLVQFFVAAFIFSGIRWLFFTDIIIKNLAISVRCVLMFLCIISVVIVFVVVFDWFPPDMILSWIMFLICFFMCSTVSVCIYVWKERSENRRMQEALERLKGEVD